ncbi:hypothetical protein [Chitinimonas sp. BJB300]|uniref:hypothetical protein n=1 Tax=Chitinimonas sp. BJB300 TaxID=1559339 RepID=UPI000C0FA626|nr:hypothetical protein [Chitinimonas sp. BJB300]PHV11946.1 hypothetical protein CSQ89_08135 [Chitinimonas sp. BJB300]TSJ87290.1 hypothetical protein FG002_015025 [Chitinimonas sp. BJB300]
MTTIVKQYQLTPLFLVMGALFFSAQADVGIPNKNNSLVSSVKKSQDYESYERSLEKAKQQKRVQKRNIAADSVGKGCSLEGIAALSGDSLIKEIKSFSCYQDFWYPNGYG